MNPAINKIQMTSISTVYIQLCHLLVTAHACASTGLHLCVSSFSFSPETSRWQTTLQLPHTDTDGLSFPSSVVAYFKQRPASFKRITTPTVSEHNAIKEPVAAGIRGFPGAVRVNHTPDKTFALWLENTKPPLRATDGGKMQTKLTCDDQESHSVATSWSGDHPV